MPRFSLINQSCVDACLEAGLSQDHARLLGMLYGLIHLTMLIYDPPFMITYGERDYVSGPDFEFYRLAHFHASVLPSVVGTVWRHNGSTFFSVHGAGWRAYWRQNEHVADIIRLEGMDAMRRDLTFLRLTVDA